MKNVRDLKNLEKINVIDIFETILPDKIVRLQDDNIKVFAVKFTNDISLEKINTEEKIKKALSENNAFIYFLENLNPSENFVLKKKFGFLIETKDLSDETLNEILYAVNLGFIDLHLPLDDKKLKQMQEIAKTILIKAKLTIKDEEGNILKEKLTFIPVKDITKINIGKYIIADEYEIIDVDDEEFREFLQTKKVEKKAYIFQTELLNVPIINYIKEKISNFNLENEYKDFVFQFDEKALTFKDFTLYRFLTKALSPHIENKYTNKQLEKYLSNIVDKVFKYLINHPVFSEEFFKTEKAIELIKEKQVFFYILSNEYGNAFEDVSSNFTLIEQSKDIKIYRYKNSDIVFVEGFNPGLAGVNYGIFFKGMKESEMKYLKYIDADTILKFVKPPQEVYKDEELGFVFKTYNPEQVAKNLLQGEIL